MRLHQLALITFMAAYACSPSHALFGFPETQKVPIDRLFTNLQQRFVKNTNAFETIYHLARLHSMAYATNLTEVNVTKKDESPVFYFPGSDAGVPRSVQTKPTSQEKRIALEHLTNAIVLYERAIGLLKKSTNVFEQQWLVLPLELGLAWCLDQSGKRDEALAAYRKTLSIAWKREVTGNFDLKQWIEDVWDDVRSGRNPIHSSRQGSLGPGVCYSDEVISYMLKLLNPVKDAREIAQLKKDRQKLQTMSRAVTPILVPLETNTSLTELTDPDAQVSFDLDGSGRPRKWGWITPKAAWLVFDADGTCRITSALQMFGSVTFWIFWCDGYDALSALDSDGDGVLRGKELRGLALWRDLNCNGVSEPGEVRPVEFYGIRAIACESVGNHFGISWNPQGVTFINGESRPTYDWIASSPSVEQIMDESQPDNHRTPGITH
ncbi:MAG: tetratricopeptide repeat protein [Verrucomicrobia bacterium]|nr:tetratricopeptide repeat protein [Verrucomicrobiota bacterium]